MSQIRTPSPLKWLIDKRARLLGEIAKRENSNTSAIENAETALKKAQSRLYYERQVNPKILEVLNADLAAIDLALGLHDVQINPEIIPEVRSHDNPRKLPYGDFTRNIYEYLKLADGIPVTTTDIATFVAIRNGVETTGSAFQVLRNAVASRIKDLRLDGKVERATVSKTAFNPKWILK